MQFSETFFGTEVIYRFNTYILRDHPVAELMQNPNPFAAVMEAAWQQLGKKKTDDQLYSTKLNLVKSLLKRKVSREKIISVINFIKYFVPFTNSENLLKFEQDSNQLIKTNQPMRLEEAILEEVKQQGIEQGIELEKQVFVHKLWSLQEFSLEKIALLVDLSPERLLEILHAYLHAEGQTEAEALRTIEAYQKRFNH